MFTVLAVLLGWSSGAGAVTLDFNGTKDVAGCTLASKVYTCNTSPITSDTDVIDIDKAATVNIKTSLTLTYNQSLRMTGAAQLNVTGDLDIGGMNTPNLQVSGGSLIASGKFTVGTVNQTLTANISAGSIAMGSGSTLKITGNVFASGAVDIASNFTLVGPLTGGTITTSAGVVLGGNVKATNAFTLASGSKVNGTVDAPVTRLLASGSVVTGAVTAKTSLFIGASNTINGDVTTGALTTEAAGSTVNGSATVDSAVLEWQARVTSTIYCSGGTTTGQCDCVTNNSGYVTGTTDGPRCSGPKVVPSALHHFQITHDGTGSACSPQPVTVTACANAGCTTLFTGGVTGTLAPASTASGNSFTIGTGGQAVQSNVNLNNVGLATLAVASSSKAPSAALTCVNTGSVTKNCDMQFDGGVGMALDFPDHLSDSVASGTLKTNAFNPSNQSCGAGFVSVTKPVQLVCKYVNPGPKTTGSVSTLPLRLSADGGATFVALNASGDAAARCDAAGRSVNLAFDANGTANLKLQYADVGVVRLDASASNAGNSGGTTSTYDQIVVSPASYKFASYPTNVIAGEPFTVTVNALNANGALVKNFGQENAVANQAVEALQFGANTPCVGQVYAPLPVTIDSNVASGGVVTAVVRYAEAGNFNIAAKQKNDNYLSSAISNTTWVYPGAQTNCGMTRAYPAYFEVRTGAGRPSPAYFYSYQPIDVTVTAKNALGATTTRYDDAPKYSYPVQISIVDPSTPAPVGALNPAPGAGLIPASAFVGGVATIKTVDSLPVTTTPTTPAVYYAFKTAPTVPTKVTLRAIETTTSNTVSSANGTKYTLATPAEMQTEIRSGRIRIGNVFGNSISTLSLPVEFEYYTSGANWLRNKDENIRIPASAIVLVTKPNANSTLATPTNVSPFCCDIVFNAGASAIKFKPNGGTGYVNVIFNLGPVAQDEACVPGSAASTGAGLVWLRAPTILCGAAKPLADPVGRATFGVSNPDAKRTVHVREVFN